MVPVTIEKKFSSNHSLQKRMLFAIAGSVLLLIACLVALGAVRIRQSSLVQVRHEGILLANTVEAAIAHYASDGEIGRIQEYIDSLTELREKNDLEVNVIFFTSEGLEIVASNLADNIEEADEEEAEAIQNAIRTGQPNLFVEVEDGPEDEEEEKLAQDPTHPDYYFPEDSRVLGITTPLEYDGRVLGGVNIKLSLHYLDQERTALMWSALTVLIAGCLILTFLLTPLLKRTVFRPIHQLASEMFTFGTTGQIGELAPTLRKDEIGVLENEFYNMVARINSAEAMRRELEQARAAQEKHEMETRLRQSQKMEALGTLAGGIAHDFNNILTPILGYTQILMDQCQGQVQEEDELRQVYQAAVRAQDLVKQILTFSRKGDEEKAPIHIGPIVKETLKLLRASIPAHIIIQSSLEDEDAVVLGNSTHIHQIVLNLATNASHAMNEHGGRLEVSLKKRTLDTPAPLGQKQTLAAGSYLLLTVEDNGEGIPSGVVERIFEPYFTTKEEGKGTGLGLAMVHGIVEDMGGVISLDTQIGKGTRFEVYLPILDEDVQTQALQAMDTPMGNGERILIVDDEAPIARMLKIMLEALGYQPVMAGTPHEAVRRLKKNPQEFHLLISDIAMPEITGVELARALSDDGITVPIILTSGYTGGINWRTAGAVGIRSILLKPIDKQKLAQTVRDILDQAEHPVGA